MKVPDAAKLNILSSKVCTKRKVQHNKGLAGSSLRVLLSDLPHITVAIKGQNPSVALSTEYPEVQVSFRVLSENEIF